MRRGWLLAVALTAVFGSVVRGALLYGADSSNNVVRIDTNLRTVTSVADTMWSRMGFDGFISAIDPPATSGPTAPGGRYYLSPYTGANGNSENCVQMVLPPAPPSTTRSAADDADAASEASALSQPVLCFGAGIQHAIWSLAVDPNTHTLYVLTSSAVRAATPEQFARNTSTVVMSPPPPGILQPLSSMQLQMFVSSVWDPLHRVVWYVQGGTGEYPIAGFKKTLVGVKPDPHGGSATTVGPLSVALPAAGVQMFWNGKAQEFAAVLSDGHYGPTDCAIARVVVDVNARALSYVTVWQQFGSYEDCANTGVWTNADGPTQHGTVWALWNDDWYQWAVYGFDMSVAPLQQPTAQWNLGEQYNFPFVALQPLA